MANIYKDKTGKLWFVGVYSNNFRDKEDEYITQKAHNKYAKWLKATGLKPPIIFLHQPQYPLDFHVSFLKAFAEGHISAEDYNKTMLDLYKQTALAVTKTVINMSGFMLVIGEILPGKEKLAQKLGKRAKEWGMSHGFIKLRNDDNIIDTYHSFEFTVAPKAIVANLGTIISVNNGEEDMEEEVKALSAEDRQILEEALNANEEDATDAFEKARELLAKFVDSKTVEEPATETPEEDEPVGVYTKFRDQIIQDLNVQGLSDIIEQLSASVKQLDTRVAQVEKTEDVRVSELLSPWAWNTVANKTEEEEEEDVELLEKLKEGVVDGVIKDTKTRSDNPLSLLFWQNPGVSN